MLQSEITGKSAFTLVELVAVVAILSIVAVLVSPRLASFAERSRIVAAEREMATIAEAFMAEEGGYMADMQGIPGFSPAYLRIGNLLVSTNLYGEAADGRSASRGVRVDGGAQVPGCAPSDEFVNWSDERQRGWRGPYLKNVAGAFPEAEAVRAKGDASFSARGFFPDVSNLRLPADFETAREGASVYGFPGEPAPIDPWGNPYVLQIPPAQAFTASSTTNVSGELRFAFARIVSAGPDGRLTTPCFSANGTNTWMETGVNWADERFRRLVRQAGLIDGNVRDLRGDDLVMFLSRSDVDEGEKP
jgi:prepilin-type N-terminal cleavage/methylation domain-containing protein